MAKIWKSEKNVWKREGFIKKSEEFLWKNDEFVWKSERTYMAQRYSKYRFFDVNCILSMLFQVQAWGCPGKPKFQFHILCVWSILYIYIICKIHIICLCVCVFASFLWARIFSKYHQKQLQTLTKLQHTILREGDSTQGSLELKSSAEKHIINANVFREAANKVNWEVAHFQTT